MLRLVILLMALWAVPALSADPAHPQTIVFVCEHGAAKSIVAASYFNKLASERHLAINAVARGTEPQDALAVSAEQGLRHDGLMATELKPKAIAPDEAARAMRVIAFLPLPKDYYSVAKVEEWNDVPATGEGYSRARDTIVAHLNKLLDALEAQQMNCAHTRSAKDACAPDPSRGHK